jgi:beta-glucosidase
LKRALAPSVKLTYSPDGSALNGAATVIVVIGEQPYAEMKGDRTDLSIPAEDAALVAKAKASGAKVATVLLSGRPLILGSVLEQSDALVAAWLPGTEGSGVADVLLGKYKPSGKLPRVWPRTNAQLGQEDGKAPEFGFGYGLTY